MLSPFLQGLHIDAVMLGNMRFMGASMLHVVCSAIVGLCIAKEFYRSVSGKILWRRTTCRMHDVMW